MKWHFSYAAEAQRNTFRQCRSRPLGHVPRRCCYQRKNTQPGAWRSQRSVSPKETLSSAKRSSLQKAEWKRSKPGRGIYVNRLTSFTQHAVTKLAQKLKGTRWIFKVYILSTTTRIKTIQG